MDNVTHALVGVTLAELALPASPGRVTRRVFMAAAVAAASAPDIDLIYTWITPAPIGYLLHHRGHSHTWPGLAVLGVLFVLAFRFWPTARAAIAQQRHRLFALIAASLASHLVLDAFNVYGTHLLYPLTTRWYFGDAVFIFEPWVWLALGVSVAWNGQRTITKAATAALTVGLPVLLAWFGIVTTPVLLALAVGGAGMSVAFARWTPRVRAATALGATMLFFTAMSGVSFLAKAEARQAFESFRDGDVVDIVTNPNPAVPWCWTVMGVARDDESAEMAVRRGTLSLLPGWMPAGSCASHQLMGGQTMAAAQSQRGIIWNDEWRGEIGELRGLYEQDCWARPWFQFGRVPFVVDGRLVDLRFENPLGTNFSAMTLRRGTGAPECPSNLTNWEPPRIDMLRR